MARQNMRVNPAYKFFEAYNDFSGGMNSEISNERLSDREAMLLENIDLSSRGSLRKRPGFTSDVTTVLAGAGQGVFFYYPVGQTDPDIIIASGGKLYLKSYASTTASEILIYQSDGTTMTFQATKQINAVQYRDTLYIATGTKLVEYSGQTDANGNPKADVVVPYKPTPMEAVYIGTNGLAANPDAYIEDKVGTPHEILGLKPSYRIGAVNETTNWIAYIREPSGTDTEFQFEYIKQEDGATWVTAQGWSLTNNFDFTPEETGLYTIKAYIRVSGTTTVVDTYQFPDYEVTGTLDESNTPLDSSSIDTCRMIKLHWNRILLAQDSNNPEHMYISDLNNPAYIPTTNSLRFESGKNEEITGMLRYRDRLVVFTNTTIQALFGKHPPGYGSDPYQRRLIHDGVGCIASRSPAIVGNSIMFLSEEGIHELKTVGYTESYLNVEKIDRNIETQITADKNACGVFFDNQYRLCIPSTNEVFRYYYEGRGGIWTKDTSSKIDFNQIMVNGSDLFYQNASDGKLFKRDETVFTDDGVTYKKRIETKRYDLGESYKKKKLKRLYLLAKHYNHDVNFKVTVIADNKVILDPTTSEAVVNADGTTSWVTTSDPNFEFKTGAVVGDWVLGTDPLGNLQLSVKEEMIIGKATRVQIIIEHDEPYESELYGLGVEFKIDNL